MDKIPFSFLFFSFIFKLFASVKSSHLEFAGLLPCLHTVLLCRSIQQILHKSLGIVKVVTGASQSFSSSILCCINYFVICRILYLLLLDDHCSYIRGQFLSEKCLLSWLLVRLDNLSQSRMLILKQNRHRDTNISFH